MKTSLAIMLAVAALAGGTATLATSNHAVAGGSGPDKWCGATVCPPKPTQSETHGRQ